MRKFQKISMLCFLSFYLLAGLMMFSPLESSAGALDVKEVTFTPQIGIPGSEFDTGNSVPAESPGVNAKGEAVMRSDLLAKYIKAFYNWGLGIVGVLAAVTLMAAGLLWITSGGKSESVGTAKKMIGGSLTGLTLLLGSYFLLNTINPNLVNLPAIEIRTIAKTTYCCDPIKGNILLDSQGKCTSSAKKCSDNQECKNVGDDIFDCTTDNGSLCCEYRLEATPNSNKISCATMPMGSVCDAKKVTKNQFGIELNFKLSKSYPNFNCGNKPVIDMDSCMSGSCIGEKNGANCKNSSDGYCYNQICYTKKGEIGDMCGNEGGECFASCTKGYNRDLGGRNCETGDCCKRD